MCIQILPYTQNMRKASGIFKIRILKFNFLLFKKAIIKVLIREIERGRRPLSIKAKPSITDGSFLPQKEEEEERKRRRREGTMSFFSLLAHISDSFSFPSPKFQ